MLTPICDVASAPILLNGTLYFNERHLCLQLVGNSDIRYIAPCIYLMQNVGLPVF